MKKCDKRKLLCFNHVILLYYKLVLQPMDNNSERCLGNARKFFFSILIEFNLLMLTSQDKTSK